MRSLSHEIEVLAGPAALYVRGFQEEAGSGFLNRKLPVGGCANGIDRKRSIFSSLEFLITRPFTVPFWIVTVTVSSGSMGSLVLISNAENNGKNNKNVLCILKLVTRGPDVLTK